MIVLEKGPYRLEHTAICIGKFDGLHRGHRLLIDGIGSYKHKQNVLFTFSFPNTASIYSEREKRYLAEQLGIDVYINCPFDHRLSHMSPETFLQEILLEQCGADVISVGEDFRFGFGRSGDVGLLRASSERDGFALHVFPKKEMFGEPVSSTRIRQMLAAGEIGKAGELLGQPYFIYGTVCHGNQIAREKLDMPTANQLLPPGKLLPPFGVYASRVRTKYGDYHGVTNIGRKPTIPGENAAGAETHIFNFNSDLYGTELFVELHAFLRGERKFSGLDALREQMKADKEQCVQYFKTHGIQ